jgi:hypothetical protein
MNARILPQGADQESWCMDEALLTDGVGGRSNEILFETPKIA